MQRKGSGLVSVLLALVVASFLFSCSSSTSGHDCKITSVRVTSDNEIVIKNLKYFLLTLLNMVH